MVSEELARKLVAAGVRVLAALLVSGHYEPRSHITSFGAPCGPAKLPTSRLASARRTSTCRVHDCFSIAEIVHYEELGFCERGRWSLVSQAGIDGRRVNTSAAPFQGHPLGAGERELAEWSGNCGARRAPDR